MDVNEAEALFRFLDGLQGDIQAWVRTKRPTNLQSAMQMAEQIGLTFAQACIIDKKGQCKHPVAIPVQVTH